MTIKERLQDWADWDLAEHELGLALGLFTEDQKFATDLKHVFWSANPVGDMLCETLRILTSVGILEHRDEPDHQYRWNPDFVGSWEEGL